jgi:phosphate starvation-inducible PhoH-like protein
MSSETQHKVVFHNTATLKQVAGTNSNHLKIISDTLGIRLGLRGNEVHIQGDFLEAELAAQLLEQLGTLVEKDYPLYPSDIDYAIRLLSENRKVSLEEVFLDTVYISGRHKIISPKSIRQKDYIDAIRGNDIVIAIGPAGTGKTYLAMAMAVSALMKHEVERIILARPAVEAGEKLGFLPGDLIEKVNPYLRPLYDALHDMMHFEKAARLVDRGVIEIAPLAFMRGRTLNNAFVILDEAQNTVPEQMKMFLTRLGFGSKAVITGDITQIDLENGKKSGLVQVQDILKGIPGISFVYFTDKDVVRHHLVQLIIRAYEKMNTEKYVETQDPLRS